MKEYILKPIMTRPTVTLTPTADKPAVVKIIPPRQPLPTAVIDPAKPMLKLGLDVHLEFIMAVAQKDHANPHAPRKFTRAQLVTQVQKWVAEGFQVFCVQESCGFGFVLHRELLAAGARVFSSRPSPSTASARPTSSMPAPCACASPAGLTAIVTNSPPSAFLPRPSSAGAKAPAAGSFWPGPSAVWPIAGTRKFPSIAMPSCRTVGGGRATGRNSPTLDPWVLGVLAKLRALIVEIEAQLAELEAELLARVPDQVTPKGLGA
jgi:hypothetical protein